MNRHRFLSTCLALCACIRPLSAQPSPPPAPAAAPGQHLLKQILIGEGIEGAQKLTPVPDGGFVLLAPGLSSLNLAELRKRLAAAENRIMDDRLLVSIAQVVEAFVQYELPLATAVIPPQNIAGGALRVAVVPGKFRDIRFKGNQWFSESLLRKKLSVERGEIVRVSTLDRSLSWANDSNPFRRLQAHVEPVPNTGEADLVIGVQDRFPLRLTASYDNTGNDVIGNHRYGASVSYGNVFGREHQATYSYLTTDLGSVLRAHSFEYRVALPWRHIVSLNGSYVRATPTLFEGYVTSIGESKSAEVRYVFPLKFQRWAAEVSASLNFKETNNNLEFLGTPVPFATNDIFSATMSATAVRDDTRGRWIASSTFVASPGHLNSRNTRAAYHDGRIGANPRFAYLQAAVQRLTRLTPGLTATSRLLGQIASTNLLGSEQFSIGGSSSVRGYRERIFSGDAGYSVTQELQHRGPTIALGKRLPALDTAVVLFCDYGHTRIKHANPNNRSQPKTESLAGVGVGLRFAAGSNFSAVIDYGSPLISLPDESNRLHARVSLAY